jgi:hypothetical protein
MSSVKDLITSHMAKHDRIWSITEELDGVLDIRSAVLFPQDLMFFLENRSEWTFYLAGNDSMICTTILPK